LAVLPRKDGLWHCGLYKVADILSTAVGQGHIAYPRCRVREKSISFCHSSEPGARAGSAPTAVHRFLASMCAIVTFRVPRNVRGEARPGNHTAKTYSKHVSCAHTSMPCKRAVLMAGCSPCKSIGFVGYLGRALEALQIRAFRGTPRGHLIVGKGVGRPCPQQ
jgi:hypothetical protein